MRKVLGWVVLVVSLAPVVILGLAPVVILGGIACGWVNFAIGVGISLLLCGGLRLGIRLITEE